MKIVFILSTGILFWIFIFKITKEKILGKIFTASLLTLSVMTLVSYRLEYVSVNTSFILIVIYTSVYFIVDWLFKKRIR